VLSATTFNSHIEVEDTEESAESSDRMLAYVETIQSLDPIPGLSFFRFYLVTESGADVIELATVRGWKVVVKKGLYKKGISIYSLVASNNTRNKRRCSSLCRN
jgi:hypothetical protein